MIEVKNITKKYGNTKVVDNVSLNIEKGKMISLIGPNGAGKSTVLSMITRLLKMDEGEVIIDGIELSKWNNAELSKKISILKQSNNINLRLTIRDLVEFGRFPYSQGNLTKEDIKYIDEALKYMNIKDIENKYLDELSGGQRQRAYIAMIIAQNTEHDINFASCYSDVIIAMKDGKVYKEGITSSIIDQNVLEDLYDTNFRIQDIDDKKICVYF